MQLLRLTSPFKAGLKLGGGFPLFALLWFFGIVPLPRANASTIYLGSLQLSNTDADGSVAISTDGLSLILTGGNTGSGLPGSTMFAATIPSAGTLEFDYSYMSLDDPGFDCAGSRLGAANPVQTGVDCAGNPLNDNFVQLADTTLTSGSLSVAVTAGEMVGWWVDTADNTGEPGILTVSSVFLEGANTVSPISFTAPAGTTTPEPASFVLAFLSIALILILRQRRAKHHKALPNGFGAVFLIALCANVSLFAQEQNHYLATSVTGQLSLTQAVNINAVAPQGAQKNAIAPQAQKLIGTGITGPESPKLPSVFPHPPLLRQAKASLRAQASPSQTLSLSAAPVNGGFGFDGLSHYDQRLADSGNQFSVEPPNPSIAVANGFVLEGVNNAVQIFGSTSGTPLLLQTVASNQLFGVLPAIDRNTGINGVFPTDMRVFYDTGISRWFVLQRSQDNDIDGNALSSSHLYLAVSQTTDPIGTYNVYVMDTTDFTNPSCPCTPDFPEIGADQYGVYISWNEYNISDPNFPQFADASILAISKLDLESGAKEPTTWKFTLAEVTGFEFAIQPAATPSGASQFIADGGVEFFVSSQSQLSEYNQLAIWALSNTASIQSANPSLLLTQSTVTILPYTYPGIATQRPGPLPYGSSLFPPGVLAFIDGGSDSRILSTEYAGGRLFVTLATQVTDLNAKSLVGGEYAIISPTLRSGVLAGLVVKQGYLAATGEHILRPAVAVNPQGQGAIGFTLAGPDYFPSAAYVNIDLTPNMPSVIQITGPGAAPEDGFTGYPGGPFAGVARWGDYSTATVGTDGTIWMVSEYISNGPRTALANWGTFVSQYVP